MQRDNIMISVCIITYNHEKYIRRALNSVLMQETIYPYEIIIGDDCSTDKTVDIIRETLKDFKGKATIITRKENIGINANDYDVNRRARGKYIAGLEGDDFWLDKHKLQKQVEYLESHPSCFAVAHKVAVVNEREHPIGKTIPSIESLNRNFGKDDAMKYQVTLFHPSSLTFHNIYKEKKYSFLYNTYRHFGGHKIFIFLSAALGGVYISDEIMGVYRNVHRLCASNHHSSGIQNELFWTYAQLDSLLYMKKYLSDYYDFTDCISLEWAKLAKYLYEKNIPGKSEILLKYFKKLTLKEKLKLPYHLCKITYS